MTLQVNEAGTGHTRVAGIVKGLEIARFEVGYQLRRWWTWLLAVALFGLSLRMPAALASDAAEAGFYNVPLLIAAAMILLSLAALVVIAAVAGEAGTRDVQTRLEPLIHVTPVSRASYLGGRFLGAVAVAALITALVPIGLAVSLYLPGVNPELVGPFRVVPYLQAYFLILLPTVVSVTAVLFSLATLSRHTLAGYGGAAVLFVLSMFSLMFMGQYLGRWELAKLTDFSGWAVLSQLWATLAPAQKRVYPVELTGGLLTNRLVWLGLGAAALAWTYTRFRLPYEAPRRRRTRRQSPAPAFERPGPEAPPPLEVPTPARSFGAATRARQVLTFTTHSLRFILRSRVLLIYPLVLLVVIATGPEVMEHIGVPYLPTTDRVLTLFGLYSQGELLFTFLIPLLAVFLAGELVWREREARLDPLTGAAPAPDWVPILGKLLATSLLVVGMLGLLILAGMLIQMRMGWFDFELDVYAGALLGFTLADFLLLVVLAFAIHVIVNQKYVGHTVVVGVYLFSLFASRLGVEHNLLVYGSDPGWRYTRVSGFGPFVGPWLWFKVYWAGWALLLVVAARLFWIRGAETGLRGRIRLARRRFGRPVAAGLAIATGVIVLAGGFIFYNTNVLNAYRTGDEREERRAEYERRYGRFDAVPQPRITMTTLRVEIRPEARTVAIGGEYLLVNETGESVDTIHLATASEVETTGITLGRPARAALVDDDLGHHIHVLDAPLQPGDSVRLSWRVRFDPRGFPNRGISTAVVGNGTYFESEQWLPKVGYQRGRELTSATVRREHGLPPREPIPALEDTAARYDLRGAERVRVETVVGTAPDQIAVAPGELLRTWTADGLRWFHYATATPIRNAYAILSARYEVHEARWNDVDVRVYHTPDHDLNVERLSRALRASLENYSERFGSYPHDRIALVEFPGYDSFLRAYPVNITYWEGFGLLNPDEDPRRIDLPFAVVAHEVAHQWWGNQLYPARVEGAALLSESLAWYSALGVVEREYGEEHLRRLLGMMRESYLTPRSMAGPPLLRANDWFVAYRKGPFAMHALREYVGEERVDRALRRLLDAHAGSEPPLATSLDLYDELRAVTPDSLHPLLGDLFERNTYWELTTREATAEETPGDEWRITLDVLARKIVVDTAGMETEVPMDDPVQVGVFAPAGPAGSGASPEPLYLATHRLRSGEQTITITVPRRPGSAGVDPRHLLIDVDGSDNIREIE